MFNVIVLVCFLVLLVSIFKNSFVLFCFCVVVFVTRLSGILVCILWSSSFLCFCCFVLNLFFFHSSRKKTPQKTGHNKNPKKQKCRNKKKRTKKTQLAQLCSQIVFFIFWGGFKNYIFG